MSLTHPDACPESHKTPTLTVSRGRHTKCDLCDGDPELYSAQPTPLYVEVQVLFCAPPGFCAGSVIIFGCGGVGRVS